MTYSEARTEWLAARAQYHAAVDQWGWNDPRTIALEEAEAIACDRYIMLGGE